MFTLDAKQKWASFESAGRLRRLLKITEVQSRTQGSRPSPRTQKEPEAKAKYSFIENRTSGGQGQECSRPRTKEKGASVLQKKIFKKMFQAISKKKRSSKKFFRQSPKVKNKKGLHKISARFLVFSKKISTIQNIVLSSSQGQGNFRSLEASRPKPKN